MGEEPGFRTFGKVKMDGSEDGQEVLVSAFFPTPAPECEEDPSSYQVALRLVHRNDDGNQGVNAGGQSSGPSSRSTSGGQSSAPISRSTSRSSRSSSSSSTSHQ